MEKSYKINKYPDGSSYVTIPKEWKGTKQYITFRINNYEDLWHLNQLCEVLTYNWVKAEIIIPNLFSSQADRRFNINESFELIQIAELLNQWGDIRFKIFHPHNSEVIEAIMNNVEIIDNFGFIRTVLDEIYPHPSGNKGLRIPNPDVILMSSDAGGFKPLMKLCDKLNWKGEVYSASKSRSYVDGKSKLTQLIDREDFGGKDILIVDDISIYGGTFKGLAKILKDKNIGKLYLAVSHMTVQNLGEDPVTDYFDKVFTTNSKFDRYLYNTACFDSSSLPMMEYVGEKLEIIKLF